MKARVNFHSSLLFTFTEFNRISIEVLSVVAVQVKCIQDAIKVNVFIFIFSRYVSFRNIAVYCLSSLVNQLDQDEKNKIEL